MPQQPKPLEYQRRPIAVGRHAHFIALSITLTLEVILASIAAKRGLLVGIFLLMAASIAVVGAIVGWFGFRRPGTVVAGCLVIAIVPTALILTAESGLPQSLDSLEEAAFYWTFPFVAIFLLPALIGGISAALLRAAFAG